jgi:hypothetical protein
MAAGWRPWFKRQLLNPFRYGPCRMPASHKPCRWLVFLLLLLLIGWQCSA